ncbi:MAG: hypothetical protein WCN95_06480 [bacterium]
MKNVIYTLLLVGLCGPSAVAEPGGKKDAFDYNKLIGRSVNLGNGLDAPTRPHGQGAWAFSGM